MIKRAAVIVIGTVFVVGCSQSSPLSSPSAPAQVGSSSASENSTVSASPGSPAFAGQRVGFSLNGTVSGFPHGVVFLSGGGAFDRTSGDVHAGGGFTCLDSVGQGPLFTSINPDDPGPCLTDQGVRWDTAALLLGSTPFKCTATAQAEQAITSDHEVVLQADFYRAGDGNEESFTAMMIVADHPISTNFPGVNIWVQGVGCGTAKNVNFAGMNIPN